MVFHVETTAQADADSRAILEWLIGNYAGDAGVRWFRELERAIKSLENSPQRCALAPENLAFPFEVRQRLYGHKPHIYRILFTIVDNVVFVVQIRHGRRRTPAPH